MLSSSASKLSQSLQKKKKKKNHNLYFTLSYTETSVQRGEKKKTFPYKERAKTMSYVPPHLRNSGPTTTTKISSVNLDNGRTNLSFSSSSSNSSLSSPSSNAFRRSSASSVPNSVLPQWQPSERVLRMKPDQVGYSPLLFAF